MIGVGCTCIIQGETGAQWYNKIKTSLYPRVMFREMEACPLIGESQIKA